MIIKYSKKSYMKKLVVLLVITLSPVSMTTAQVDWRFGFEWNEGGLSWKDPHIERLLTKLENIGTPGGINVNGVAAWQDMQSSATAPINFNKMDDIVRVFQNHGFSLTPYLNCNAPWAFPSKNISQGEAAPDPAFEQYWIDFIKAVVERYDGDGFNDMPELTIPIRYYVYTGEIVYSGSGKGDAEWGPYWLDTIDNLLRLHRITYKAINEADPSGKTKVVSAGAILFDLFADFPDYPDFDPIDPNSRIRKHLAGENYRGSTYTAGWDSLKKMLDSFGNDDDGIECDYIGWHPHFNWRVIDQEFAFIQYHAGNKPIFVDDMWTNIACIGYNFGASIPGFAQFNAPAWPPENSNWVKNIAGDLPNSLFTSLDPHGTLLTEILNGNANVIDWYYSRQAREIVKSVATAFGEGAERVCLSGTNDLPEIQNFMFGSIGWINILGTRREDYPEKAGYYTYKLLVEKLYDFSTAAELPMKDPRTRVYEFNRPGRGPVYVLWSETGEAPPNLDYRIPTGETVTLKILNNAEQLILTHIIRDTETTEPEEKTIAVQNGRISIQLGYEPIFLQGDFLVAVNTPQPSPIPSSFDLLNYPNPFNPATTIEYSLSRATHVTVKIYNLLGLEVRTLVDKISQTGIYQTKWDGMNDNGQPVASGVYVYQLHCDSQVQTRKMTLMK